MACSAGIGWPIGSAIQLLILTCALKWSEIDGARKEIRLEGKRTKNGAPHIIPLSTAAQKLIEAGPRVAASDFVFSTTGKTPISGWSRAKTSIDQIMLSRARLETRARGDDEAKVVLTPWRIHDLRRTAATGMERLDVRQQVVEALLGHIAGSKAGVVGIYQRHSYEEEKRTAVEKWAHHVTSLLRTGHDLRLPAKLQSRQKG